MIRPGLLQGARIATAAQDDLALGGTGNAGFLTFPMGPSAVEPIIDALTRDVELARHPAHAYVFDPII